MYIIYKITGPNGKNYVGLTKQKLNARWGQHVNRALKEQRNHPLYNAIRKYGAEGFKIETIAKAGSKPEAQALEKHFISLQPERLKYNISPGGEADGEYGAKVFWDFMESNPEAKKTYLEKLSNSKKNADWSDYEAMGALAQEWRSSNPKEAYKLSLRALRIANRDKPKKAEDVRDLKTRLLWKHNRSKMTRDNALKQWESMDAEERAEMSVNISRGVKKYWSGVVDPEERSALTSKARNSIDRSVQGPAASKGLKKFWEDLRKDPDKYQEYIDRRTETLKEKLRKDRER